jgi:hypothetical protein
LDYVTVAHSVENRYDGVRRVVVVPDFDSDKLNGLVENVLSDLG